MISTAVLSVCFHGVQGCIQVVPVVDLGLNHFPYCVPMKMSFFSIYMAVAMIDPRLRNERLQEARKENEQFFCSYIEIASHVTYIAYLVAVGEQL